MYTVRDVLEMLEMSYFEHNCSFSGLQNKQPTCSANDSTLRRVCNNVCKQHHHH